MKKLFFSLIVVSFLIGAVSVLAQENNATSTGIDPDSPFYFLKTWKEQIQTFFTFGEENKAKQFLHLADVRLAEYQKMIEKGKTEIAQKTLDKYEKQLSHAIQKIEELQNKGVDVEDLSEKLSTTTLKHVDVLQENLLKVPESGKEGIKKALDAIRKGVRTKKTDVTKEQACLKSEGTVSTSSCCESAADFPNLCLIGACGCSLENSTTTTVCNCGEGKCFNGEECVEISAE
ncbi:MAG: DUF5667 domain-containing protein [Candidatus Pacebacteria bacterium]|nr:DUF5667 domain-containing protein [Candidatus Paceibacterota bacterium]